LLIIFIEKIITETNNRMTAPLLHLLFYSFLKGLLRGGKTKH